MSELLDCAMARNKSVDNTPVTFYYYFFLKPNNLVDTVVDTVA